MKMTLTNIDIANIVNYVNSENSIAKNTAMKFAMEFAWKFRKNVKKLTDAYEIFTKMQEEIMQSYSTDEYSIENENGERFVKPEYIEEYSKKLNELYAQTNEINIDMVKVEKICVGGMDKLELSIPELEAISFMIDDSFEEEDKVEKVDVEME